MVMNYVRLVIRGGYVFFPPETNLVTLEDTLGELKRPIIIVCFIKAYTVLVGKLM